MDVNHCPKRKNPAPKPYTNPVAKSSFGDMCKNYQGRGIPQG